MSNLQFSLNVSAAESFLDDFSSDSDSFFLMISKPESWPNDNTPPTSLDTSNNQFDSWSSAIAAKKITSEDVRLVTNRYDWTSGITYSQFSDTDEIFRSSTFESRPFYVMTPQYRVYKCLDNNGGNVASTVQPTHTYPEYQTPGADGYVWQFIYQLKEDDLDFVTDDYIPVSVAGSTTKIGTIEYLQREVQENASNGGVFGVRLDMSGSYWSSSEIMRSKGASSDSTFYLTHKVFALDNGAFFTDPFGDTVEACKWTVNNSYTTNEYINWALTDLDMGSPSGGGDASDAGGFTKIGYYKKILGISGGNEIYTPRFETTPSYVPSGASNSAYFNIVPYIYVASGTGNTSEQNAVIYPVFEGISADFGGVSGLPKDSDGIVNQTKVITNIRVLNPGSGITDPSIQMLTPSTSDTSGAGFAASAVGTPLGGHGSNAVYELGANKVMIRTLLKGSEGGAFDVQNDFRKFSVVKNPQLAGWTAGVTAGLIAGTATPNFTKIDIRNKNNTAVINFHTVGTPGMTHPVDAFVVGQKVHQGEYSTTQARGTVLSWVPNTAGKLTVSVDNGSFRACVIPDERPSSVTSGRIFYGETTGTGYTFGGDGNSFGGFVDSVTHSKTFVNESFPIGSIVYGMNSGSTAKVTRFVADADGERGTITLTDNVGSFIGPRVALGTQLDGEDVFGFKSLSSDGTVQLSNSPVGTITKIKSEPVNIDESHRLTTKVQSFFTSPQFQLNSGLLDLGVTGNSNQFSSTLVSFSYATGTTSGPSGSTTDMYVTSTIGSLTAGNVISVGGYTGEVLGTTIPEFLKNTGQVLYIENVRPVQRNPDQDEEIKVVIDF